MKKSGKLKWFSLGAALCLLVTALAAPAMASSGERSAKLFFRDISIILNGTRLHPADASGKSVEPFIIDGTTYLPVRAVADAMGLQVGWDENTNTITLTDAAHADAAGDGEVIMDANGVKVTYLGMEASDSYLGGWGVKLLIENSSAKNYTVQVRNASVNGLMTDAVFSCGVAAGKSAYDEILFTKSALDKNGLTAAETAEFSFHVFETETWLSDFDSPAIAVGG